MTKAVRGRAWAVFAEQWRWSVVFVIILRGFFWLAIDFLPDMLRSIAIVLDAALMLLLLCAIISLALKQWRRGALILALFALAWVSCYEPLHALPASIETPADRSSRAVSPARDVSGQVLIEAITRQLPIQTAPAPVPISVDFPVLGAFSGPDRYLLLRHLATSAQWCLTRDRGFLHAFRRFPVQGRWLNGPCDFSDLPEQNAQFLIQVDPDGPAARTSWSKVATHANIADRVCNLAAVNDTEFGQGVQSYLVLRSDKAALEVFEQSRSYSRPFTPLALSQIDAELRAVLASDVARQQGFDASLMPPESIKTGPAEIHLVDGGQGGIYHVLAYANPGEAGRVYIKAFHAATDTQLSAGSILEDSTAWMGWSDIPGQQFYYTSEVIFYEGNWDTFFPARIELWFVPDSGKPERKLVENTFQVCGWER